MGSEKIFSGRTPVHCSKNLSSRPEESWACGPPKVMKNTFGPATALYGSVTLPFVIPESL